MERLVEQVVDNKFKEKANNWKFYTSNKNTTTIIIIWIITFILGMFCKPSSSSFFCGDGWVASESRRHCWIP